MGAAQCCKHCGGAGQVDPDNLAVINDKHPQLPGSEFIDEIEQNMAPPQAVVLNPESPSPQATSGQSANATSALSSAALVEPVPDRPPNTQPKITPPAAPRLPIAVPIAAVPPVVPPIDDKMKGCHSTARKEQPLPSAPMTEMEAWVQKHPYVSKAAGGAYLLDQSFAIVRHGDRLDHTPEWDKYPERKKYPNDTPLTAIGHTHAKEVGQALKAGGKPFELIICSPYYRCAQTASRIAEVLKIPVHFDLDLGEVFDEESMGNGCKGKPQHRDKKILKSKITEEFPNVEYVCDDKSNFVIEGQQQHWPEAFAGARMRFCYKTKKLLQKASSELMSVVIVTHGDAVAAVVGLLREAWSIKNVPYCAYAVASRKVKVLEKGGGNVLKEETVYAEPETWDISVGKGFSYEEIKTQKKKDRLHKEHEQEMKDMNAMAAKLKAQDYDLEYEHHEHYKKEHHKAHHDHFKASLARLGASDGDIEHLIIKAQSSHHIATENANRLKCKEAH